MPIIDELLNRPAKATRDIASQVARPLAWYYRQTPFYTSPQEKLQAAMASPGGAAVAGLAAATLPKSGGPFAGAALAGGGPVAGVWGRPADRGPGLPQLDVARQYGLALPPARSVYAQRALQALDAGMQPGDRRFAGMTREQIAQIANPPVAQAGATGGAPAAAASTAPAAAPQGSKRPSGVTFNDGWLDTLDLSFSQQAYANPPLVAQVALESNGIAPNSPGGDFFMQSASMFREIYQIEAQKNPGTLDPNGSDFPAFVQGMLEGYFSPADTPQNAAARQQIAGGAQQYANEFYVNPAGSQLVSDLELATENPQASSDGRVSTPADAVYYTFLAPTLLAMGLMPSELQTAQAGVQKDYETYRKANAAGRFPGTFVQYLQAQPGTYTGSYFGR